MNAAPALVHYLPLVTTAIAVAFFIVLCRAIRTRKTGPHLWWWAAGVAFYGLGTALEGSITLFGNTLLLTKVWYIAGALLGGYPLAQGVVYLLLKRKTANVLSYVTVPFIVAMQEEAREVQEVYHAPSAVAAKVKDDHFRVVGLPDEPLQTLPIVAYVERGNDEVRDVLFYPLQLLRDDQRELPAH